MKMAKKVLAVVMAIAMLAAFSSVSETFSSRTSPRRLLEADARESCMKIMDSIISEDRICMI